MSSLERFTQQWAVLLTSYRRDGTPVGTPVSLAVDGDRAFVRSPGTAWKVKRIRRDPRVEIAPCTARGRPTGPPLAALARPLDGAEADRAASALRRKHPVLQGLMVPIMHRLLRCGTVHFELRPREAGERQAPRGRHAEVEGDAAGSR